MKIPQKIKILSDDNELEFLETIKPKTTGVVHYIYRYSKSFTKLGNLVGYTEQEINTMIKNKIIEAI